VGASDCETGFAVGFATATPLFQTNFLPDFTQVNFFPAVVLVLPDFAHAAPALTAAVAGGANSEPSSTAATKSVNVFFIVKFPFVRLIFSNP
jgi:hypothetical protein